MPQCDHRSQFVLRLALYKNPWRNTLVEVLALHHTRSKQRIREFCKNINNRGKRTEVTAIHFGSFSCRRKSKYLYCFMVEKANRFARMFFVEQGRRRRRADARQGGERRSAENRLQRYRFFNREVVLRTE